MAEKNLENKDKVSGQVVRTTLAGALVDIGLDQPAILPISQLSKEAVKRVEDVVKKGDAIEAWVRRTAKKEGRVELTLVEPLLLEWRDIKKGMTLKGKVGRIEKFGAFIELGAERPGMVHVSEMSHEYVRSPEDIVKVDEEVEVHVLEVNRRKKQIKLSMKSQIPETVVEEEEEEEEEAPTAMELAYRKAMSNEDSATASPEQKNKSESNKGNEMEDILARTLQNRVRTE